MTSQRTEPTMEVLALFNGKGGVGKSTLTPICAAAIKNLFPKLRVGVIAADTDQCSLSWSYAPDLENADKGLWDYLALKMDRRTRGDKGSQEKAIRDAVRSIKVVPGAKGDAGCIDFMACAGEIGKQWQNNDPMGRPESYEEIGQPALEDISGTLGWDVCLLDMPGSIKDPLVYALLPCCTSVVVLSDCGKPENLSMERGVIQTMKRIGVTAKGFLANKVTDSKPSVDALSILHDIAWDMGLEVIGAIRSSTTLSTANRPYSKDYRQVYPGDEWVLPEGGLHMGLYVMRSFLSGDDKRKGPNEEAIHEMEKTAVRLMEDCFRDNAGFRAELRAAAKRTGDTPDAKKTAKGLTEKATKKPTTRGK